MWKLWIVCVIVLVAHANGVPLEKVLEDNATLPSSLTDAGALSSLTGQGDDSLQVKEPKTANKDGTRSLVGPIDGWIMIPGRTINRDIISDSPAKSTNECVEAIAAANKNVGAWDITTKKCIVVASRKEASTMYLKGGDLTEGYSVNFSVSVFTVGFEDKEFLDQNPMYRKDMSSKCDIVSLEGTSDNMNYFCVNYPRMKSGVVLVRQTS